LHVRSRPRRGHTRACVRFSEEEAELENDILPCTQQPRGRRDEPTLVIAGQQHNR
jgi:hypothetical protein